MSHLIGYARTSTTEQDPQLQLDALTAAGCARIFIESASGMKTSRPELDAALDYLREGDQLVVWRLDRLGRSLPHLLEVLAQLDGPLCQPRVRQRGIGVSLRIIARSQDWVMACIKEAWHMTHTRNAMVS